MAGTRSDTRNYRGRFAPSPTGALHFGSLLAALASFLDARAHRGHWLLRMEDLDPPREIKGAADQILRTLERFGFYWDGPVRYQSQRLEHYAQAAERLLEQDQAYPCLCSRQQIAKQLLEQQACSCSHPQNARHTLSSAAACGDRPAAIRVRTHDARIGFTDAIQGNYPQQSRQQLRDFVIRRKDRLYAYQLAVVIDDADQQISHIVRGYDLIDSTPRQIHLQQLLRLATPEYAHIPILVNHLGQKLSKQTFASALDLRHPEPSLFQALTLLGHRPPEDLRAASTHEMLDWGINHWRRSRVPQQPHLAESLLES
ncbi:MAG: glutamyl-Q tRNA(Asp) synthetase [Motiliproteus sp.]|jgi:glutamyl-Q tRNA(Asp) synthetase